MCQTGNHQNLQIYRNSTTQNNKHSKGTRCILKGDSEFIIKVRPLSIRAGKQVTKMPILSEHQPLI